MAFCYTFQRFFVLPVNYLSEAFMACLDFFFLAIVVETSFRKLRSCRCEFQLRYKLCFEGFLSAILKSGPI